MQFPVMIGWVTPSVTLVELITRAMNHFNNNFFVLMSKCRCDSDNSGNEMKHKVAYDGDDLMAKMCLEITRSKLPLIARNEPGTKYPLYVFIVSCH